VGPSIGTADRIPAPFLTGTPRIRTLFGTTRTGGAKPATIQQPGQLLLKSSGLALGIVRVFRVAPVLPAVQATMLFLVVPRPPSPTPSPESRFDARLLEGFTRPRPPEKVWSQAPTHSPERPGRTARVVVSERPVLGPVL